MFTPFPIIDGGGCAGATFSNGGGWGGICAAFSTGGVGGWGGVCFASWKGGVGGLGGELPSRVVAMVAATSALAAAHLLVEVLPALLRSLALVVMVLVVAVARPLGHATQLVG
eukprot:CAMPEP_0169413944 /NCGR_PEP_ID=MMETSP1017-20121227/61641_1 /TAXON_ID=342587 /ORGANISM="Karlodinium micrum, Strain CCMP2283" /LENGTH=112 /DNA_ID=CAMNT_0009521423 /DNA_START=134 /DNA_END=469 /DNA_ORIENTATION=+